MVLSPNDRRFSSARSHLVKPSLVSRSRRLAIRAVTTLAQFAFLLTRVSLATGRPSRSNPADDTLRRRVVSRAP